MHEPGVKEHLEVLGRGRLLRAHGFSDLPHCLLASLERDEDADPRAITQCARPRRDELDLFT